MKKGRGFFGTVFSFIVTLSIIGIVLAVLTVFNWDFGLIIRWILEVAWSIISSVRDTVLSWDALHKIF